MKISEAIAKTKKDGQYTDENLEMIKQAVLEENLTDFHDPRLKELVSFFNEQPYDERVQNVIYVIAEEFSKKGIMSPCVNGCSDECTFHEAEMNGRI